MGMRAGRLNRQVIIKEPIVTGHDTAGAEEIEFLVFAKPWARVDIISGSERWANEHVATKYDAVVTIRYREGLQENMRVHDGDRVLEIKAFFDPYSNKTELKLLCTDYGN